MAVEIKRDPNLAVAEPLTRYLRMHTGGQHVRSVSMPKVVKSNSRKMRGKGCPHLREAARLHWRAVLTRINESGVRLPHAKPEKLLGLIKAMLAQFRHNSCGQR